LFTDDKFNALNGETNQATIDDAKAAVDKLPAGEEKTRLENLISDAQDLFDAKTKAAQELSDAKAKTEGLFSDDKFNALNGETNQATIDDAKAAVDKLPAGEEKTRLENLINDAQDLFDAKTKATQELSDAKAKTESLFTDDKFNALNGETNQATIDDAKAAVDKLPAGEEKTRLENLIKDAQDLFDAKTKAAQELSDAKAKTEGLFTDDKFNALNGETKQAAIDEAKTAVAKLPTGAEKTRLENLIKDAQDLFDAKTKAAQERADAKNKVESLFTDNNFNTLNNSVNQSTIDDAQKSLANLPTGEEKDRLQQLIDKAKELLSLKLTIKADELFVGQTTVYGTSVLSDVYRVYIYLNGELVRYRNVIDGTFYGHVSNNLKAGDVVRLVPTDAKGNQGKAIEVFVQENNTLGAPTLNKYYEGDATLSGKVADGTSYVNVYVNDILIRKRNVEVNGVDLISYLGDAGAKVGDVIKVVPYNNKNEAGKATTITVVAPPIETTDYLAGDSTLYGKTTATADKVDIYVNGQFLRTRIVDKTTGEFFASMLRDGILPKEGDEIKIVSRTDKGVILAQDIVIVGAPESQVAPTVNEFYGGMTNISGTIPQGATKVRFYYGTNLSQVINRGAIDQENQTFSAYVGDLKLKSGDQIKVVTINDKGRESLPVIIDIK
ncbi:toxin Cry1Ac domain D-VI-related protein, partial [Gottfriedia sp. NPDC057991]|uniref:toxin Cry1Ac domain D-VI-related protein n=1 Tax=Gottfriedia sp. NPDC057991 TaxID=3346298 RepID=UPI0036DB4C13